MRVITLTKFKIDGCKIYCFGEKIREKLKYMNA